MICPLESFDNIKLNQFKPFKMRSINYLFLCFAILAVFAFNSSVEAAVPLDTKTITDALTSLTAAQGQLATVTNLLGGATGATGGNLPIGR